MCCCIQVTFISVAVSSVWAVSMYTPEMVLSRKCPQAAVVLPAGLACPYISAVVCVAAAVGASPAGVAFVAYCAAVRTSCVVPCVYPRSGSSLRVWGRPLVLPGFGFDCSFASFGLCCSAAPLPDPAAPSDGPGMWLSPELTSPLLPADSWSPQAAAMAAVSPEAGAGAATTGDADPAAGTATAALPHWGEEGGAEAAARQAALIADEYMRLQHACDQASMGLKLFHSATGSSSGRSSNGSKAADNASSSTTTTSRADIAAPSLWGWKFCVSAANRQELFNAYAAIGPSHCCSPRALDPLLHDPKAATAAAAAAQEQGVYDALTHSFSPVLSVALLQWLVSDFSQHPEVLSAASKNPQVAAALGTEAAAAAAAGEACSSLALVPAAAFDPALFLGLVGAADAMAAVSPLPLQASALAVARSFVEVYCCCCCHCCCCCCRVLCSRCFPSCCSCRTEWCCCCCACCGMFRTRRG